MKHQVTKHKYSLVAVERKLQVASSAASSAHHSALAKLEEAHKCREEVDDGEERLKAAQVAASKARVDAEGAMEEESKFEADYVAKVGYRRDEIEELTK